MRIEVKRKGKDAKAMIRHFKTLKKISEQKFIALGRSTQEKMQSTIDTNVKRKGSTGKLRDSIDFNVNRTGLSLSWTIGTINKLPKYWGCLREDTEVYVLKDNKIIPITLLELYNQKAKINKILTPFGLKNIKNIFETNVKEEYKIKLKGYKPLYSSGDHRFLSQLNKNKVLEKQVKNFPKKSIEQYSLLFNSLNSINKERIIKEVKINLKKVKLDYNFGYLIGFVLGDGSIRQHTISIHQKKLEPIYTKFKNFCNKYKVQPWKYKSNNCYTMGAKTKIKKIFTYFINGKKDNKKFTNFYLNTPVEFRLGILKGYKNSDGRKTVKSGDDIRTISKELRSQLLLIASSLGYDISWRKSCLNNGLNSFKSKRQMYNSAYFINSKNANKFNKANKINKERKRNNLGRFYNEFYFVPEFIYKRRFIKAIKKTKNNKRYFDLNVELGLFLVEGGIISHNSINYGGIPGGGKYRPYLFEDGYADASKRGGEGTSRAIGVGKISNIGGQVPTAIEPMNFVEKAKNYLISKIRVQGLGAISI